MPRCSAAGCRNMGSHSFPKDPNLRKLWETATGKDNYTASKYSRLCAEHFKKSDYVEVCSTTGVPPYHRYLKKTAVPTIFHHKNTRIKYKTKPEITRLNEIKTETKSKETEEIKDAPENTSQSVQPENEPQEGNTSFRDKSQRLRNKKDFLAKRSRCTVPQCNGEVSSEVSLHLCPNNPAVRQEWAEAFKVRYSFVKTLIACSKHFTKLDFFQSKNGERVLKHNAVPSRNLPTKGRDVKYASEKKYGPTSTKRSTVQKQIMNNNASVEDLQEEKEEKVLEECRACLKKLDDKQSVCNIFQPWALPWTGMEPTIAEDLAKLANIEVSQTDRHSKVLCEPCYQKLLDAATFASTVRNCDLVLRMRFTAEIDMEKVWPKPIQVDKNINGSVYTNPMNVEIKQEVVTDEEYPVNGQENQYVEELSNLDIKIEPEEFVEAPPLNITINGTISLDPLNSENRELMNGPQLTQEATQFIELTVKQEPTSDGEQEIELAPDLPLECMLCAKSFHSVTGLKAHVIAHHSYKSVKRKSDGSVSPEKKRTDKYTCGICNVGFKTSTDLMVHETCHNKYACYACSRKFDSFPMLTRHRKRCKASASRSVQKLKTLEDVKRPAVEDILKDFGDGETLDEVETEVEPALPTEDQEQSQEQDNIIGQEDLEEMEPDNLTEEPNVQNTEEQTEITNEDVEMKDLTNSYREELDKEDEKVSVDKESTNEAAVKSLGDEIQIDSSETISNVENESVANENSDKNINKSEVNELESCMNLETESKVDEDPDRSMELHLEIHSSDKKTEPQVNDIDMAVGTMKNDDCT
ncbi:unnamed protein product [Spodoptera exigua]|nr:unnamed protein product [Spodoptera exigua]